MSGSPPPPPPPPSFYLLLCAGTLPRLTKLLAASNSLTGRLPWELCNLTALTELLLSGNAFTPEPDSAIARRQKQLPNCRILL